MPTPILTSVRQAVWNAIDTWPALEGQFARTYRYEDRPGTLGGRPTPSIGDLPALSIYPDSARTSWTLNQSQDVRYPLRFDVWTREWDVRTGERLWEEIVKALYQGVTPSVEAPHRVVGVSPMSPDLVPLSADGRGPWATRWSFRVELSAGFWNPSHA